MADGLTVSVERVEAVGAEAILLHLLLTDGEHEEHRTCTVLPEIYATQSFSVGPISREDYRVILRAEELSTAIKKGMQMLAFSDASFAGIVRKLMQKGTDEKTARSAARYLRAKGYIREQDAGLTQNEFRIVSLLGKYAGKVLTYDFIIKEIWGPNMKNDNRILRVNMANIRRKIEKNPAEPQYIFTEVGVGYRIVEPD